MEGWLGRVPGYGTPRRIKTRVFDRLGPRTKSGVTQNHRDAKMRHLPEGREKSAPLSQNHFCVRATRCIGTLFILDPNTAGPPRRWTCHGEGVGGSSACSVESQLRMLLRAIAEASHSQAFATSRRCQFSLMRQFQSRPRGPLRLESRRIFATRGVRLNAE
jgi:hypothetical protein